MRALRGWRAFYRISVEGKSAPAALFAAAACSGLHAHPVRPVSVIGPNSEGAVDGCKAVSNMPSMEEAPAKPAAAVQSAAAATRAWRRGTTGRLDITFSIAESLKNP
jgi:hypothetical protein